MQVKPLLLLTLCSFGLMLPANAQSQQGELNFLRGLLNRVDGPQGWTNPPANAKSSAIYSSAPDSAVAAQRLGRILSSAGSSLFGGASQGNAAATPAENPGNSSPYVPQGTWQTNPFSNLTPFGMLHYIWDDTQYVSSSNPITLTEVRGELQQAQNYSQMAQSAATRARYAYSPQERQKAVAEAQQYAAMAQSAANQANAIADGGSSNPSDVAALAQQQALQAQRTAADAAAKTVGNRW